LLVSQITSAKSDVVLNFSFFLLSIILAAIFVLDGSSQYLIKICLKSLCVYEFTISAAVFHLVLSNLISRGQSNLKLNHLSGSSTWREDIHKS